MAEGDNERAAAELHPHVVVERPHEGARHTGRAAYLEPYAGLPVEVLRTVTEGRQVAVDARAGDWAVAGFFTLHDGRVLHATEYWVRRPG